MTDNRFKDFPIDARFPSPGVDFRFAELGVDARFRDGLDTRFQGDTYGAFNPRTLFGTTDTGWFYDLYDRSTLFQDAAGATPVTAVNQPVGLQLDKSKGLVLGPELVTNGGFDTDTVWTKGAGVTIGGGVASFSNVASGAGLLQTIGSVVAGRAYRIRATISNYSSGTLVCRLSTGSFISLGAANGTTDVVVFAGGTLLQVLAGGTGSTFDVDNISVRELPGNHRSQSASLPRPTYARHPLGGIRNLLTFTEQFDNAAWNKTNVTVSPGAVDPNGGSSAWTLTATGANGQVLQFIGGSLGTSQNYTGSFWIRRRAGVGTVSLFNPNGGGITAINLTSSWQRFSVTGFGAASTNFHGARLSISGDEVDIWCPQLELGSTTTPYQRVVSVFDVTEAGVPDLYYLSYDGLNDSLSTSAFAWGTDKATICAGVRNLNDTTVGVIAEHSTSTATNNGAFILAARETVSNYFFASKGTISADVRSPASYPAPITNILTALGDISGDRATLRVNGTQVAQLTTDQGTGNYGTHAAFFGARAGTSLFFNGWEYSNVGISRLLTENELAALERWTAQRTGVTL